MAYIEERKRKGGSMAYRGSIRIKRKGKIIHSETRTFDRKQHGGVGERLSWMIDGSRMPDLRDR